MMLPAGFFTLGDPFCSPNSRIFLMNIPSFFLLTSKRVLSSNEVFAALYEVVLVLYAICFPVINGHGFLKM